MSGYVNADINANLPNIDLVCSLDAIPVADDTYTEIIASHCIEHVPIPTAKKALREWLRVLAPGGAVRIDTPNVHRNVSLYLRDNDDWLRDYNNLTPAERERLLLNGVPNKTLWLNFKMFSSEHLYDVHYWNADGDLLVDLCKEAGFARAEVTQTEPSLMVVATKAA